LCYQHYVCGTLVTEDVVLRLRKVQILNCVGREETAIAAHHVSEDGSIDQCCVGFLQRHFVAHAKTFDGALAQVTEVYSTGSDSLIKQKKWRHNMGCCLAALISDFSSAAKCTTSKATTALSWLKVQMERKTVQKWRSSPVWDETKTFLCPMTKMHEARTLTPQQQR
jgi:hypothetical protein